MEQKMLPPHKKLLSSHGILNFNCVRVMDIFINKSFPVKL